MPKYEVLIARTETTLYTIEVNAKNQEEAEEKAYKKWAKGDYEDEDVVYGEEETYEINEIEDIENVSS